MIHVHVDQEKSIRRAVWAAHHFRLVSCAILPAILRLRPIIPLPTLNLDEFLDERPSTAVQAGDDGCLTSMIERFGLQVLVKPHPGMLA